MRRSPILPSGSDPLRLKVNMTVNHPVITGGNTWQPQTTTYGEVLYLRLASPGAGGVYRLAWWGGVTGGVLLTSLGGILLAFFGRAYRNEALPTKIIVSGHGDFLVSAALEHVQERAPIVRLSHELGTAFSRCASAHALAVLAREAAQS